MDYVPGPYWTELVRGQGGQDVLGGSFELQGHGVGFSDDVQNLSEQPVVAVLQGLVGVTRVLRGDTRCYETLQGC